MNVVRSMKNRTTTRIYAGGFAMAIAISGCAVAPPPIAHTPTVGEVTPVYVSVANGTNDTRSVVPSQVFALNDAGERVAPLPPGEAARQAGSAKELEGAVKSGAVSGVGGAALGAAAGAIAGTAGRSAGWFGFGSPGAGALVGTAFGGAYGVFSGAEKGQSKADQQANQQIEALSLKPEEVRKDFTVSGYVFFPKGQYDQVEMLLVDRETGDTQIVREPWH